MSENPIVRDGSNQLVVYSFSQREKVRMREKLYRILSSSKGGDFSLTSILSRWERKKDATREATAHAACAS